MIKCDAFVIGGGTCHGGFTALAPEYSKYNTFCPGSEVSRPSIPETTKLRTYRSMDECVDTILY